MDVNYTDYYATSWQALFDAMDHQASIDTMPATKYGPFVENVAAGMLAALVSIAASLVAMNERHR